MTQDQLDAFLVDLEALYRKHEMVLVAEWGYDISVMDASDRTANRLIHDYVYCIGENTVMDASDRTANRLIHDYVYCIGENTEVDE